MTKRKLNWFEFVYHIFPRVNTVANLRSVGVEFSFYYLVFGLNTLRTLEGLGGSYSSVWYGKYRASKLKGLIALKNFTQSIQKSGKSSNLLLFNWTNLLKFRIGFGLWID